jgi:uncharacterized protein (DUF305 family)
MSNRWTLVAAAAVVALALAAVAGCGDDDSDEAATQTDGAFITEMTAHHEAAIEMAEMAQKRADHVQIRRLADGIVAAQSDEIDEMGTMHEEMFGAALAEDDHGTMGMSAHDMGMDMDMMGLEDAEPFDRAFIDAMIAHHQGAIRMARVELEQGSDSQLHALCNAIIEAQSREIEQMNTWREHWYGAPSPAGGASDEDESMMPSHDMMDH